MDEWLGHSTKTAEEHYLQVTADHWNLGACLETGGNAGGNISANPEAFTVTRNEKIPENHIRAGSRFSGILQLGERQIENYPPLASLDPP